MCDSFVMFCVMLYVFCVCCVCVACFMSVCRLDDIMCMCVLFACFFTVIVCA